MAGRDLSKNLAAVGALLPAGEDVVDAALEPARAASLLSAAGPVWLRALPVPGAPSGDGYGPAPQDPAWIRVARGSARVDVVRHGVRVEATKAEVSALAVDVTSVAWGTTAAPIAKHLARAIVTVEPGGAMVVGSAIADDEALARAALGTIVAPLAIALGVEVDAAEASAPGADDPSPGASSSSAVGRELVRFTLGWEGDRRVLRDLADPGPRAAAWIWASVAIASGIAAAVTIGGLAAGLRAGAGWTTAAAQGGVALVFALGAFAFFHVARHALRYRAAGTPIAVFADDRVVVMPWVRRDGAIDPKPESRFGAGVRVAEIRKVHVVERDGARVVSLDTEHGPIDVAGGVGPEALEVLRLAIERAGVGIAAPRRKTAIMRARERTQREAEA